MRGRQEIINVRKTLLTLLTALLTLLAPLSLLITRVQPSLRFAGRLIPLLSNYLVLQTNVFSLLPCAAVVVHLWQRQSDVILAEPCYCSFYEVLQARRLGKKLV